MKISLPEQVWIDLEPASFGSRSLAFLLDILLRYTLLFLAFIATILAMVALSYFSDLRSAFSSVTSHGGSIVGQVAMALFVVLVLVMEFGYTAFFEVRRNGVTPGKKVMGLRVVDQRGLPITLRASFLRTLLTPIDLIPGPALVAMISMMLSSKSQRLGDLVAKTMVVHEIQPVVYSREETSVAKYSLPIELYNAIEQFLARRKYLSADARRTTLAAIVNAIRGCVPNLEGQPRNGMDEISLEKFFNEAKPSRASSTKSTAGIAQLFHLRPKLQAFEQLLSDLDGRQTPLSSDEVRKLALIYQEVCQLYAYLQTFYPSTSEAQHAAQLVRGGRQVVYGNRLSRFEEKSELPYFTRIAESFHAVRAHVAVSFSLALVSSLICAFIVQLNPNMSWYFLSEDIAGKLAQGKLWTEDVRGMSTVAASQIMTNNIKVTFIAFSMGITAGVGTVLILVFNGIHLGGIFSALSYYNMAGRLLDFVVAHGFLELSIIFVAGGCGLFLGDAILNPGNKSRGKAIGDNSKQLVELIWFNAGCLVLAGLVEGFVSPYPIPFSIKLTLGVILGSIYWSILWGFFPLKTAARRSRRP